MARKGHKQTPRCGFCGCTAKQVKILIQGKNGNICGECVVEARAILDADKVETVVVARQGSA